MKILKKIAQGIFAVRNEYVSGFKYNIIRILGVKFKFKSTGYSLKGQNNNIYVIENSVKKPVKKRIKGLGIDIVGDNNEIVINSPYKFNSCIIYMKGNNASIIMGGGTELDNVHFDTVNNSRINVGKNTTMNGGRIACISHDSSINIGEDCMFSWNVHIMSGDFHNIICLDDKSIINKGHFCDIGNHVWLGCGATICKNVKIADNCIVGTNSVVTKSCDEKNVVLAGNPAKIIKRNVNWDRENDD